jgi:adenosylhomocysteine nucleosidase
MTRVNIHEGIIASGDQFISSEKQKQDILSVEPNTLVVEMEGGALGQVCHEIGMKYCVVRVVSDGGDSSAFFDYQKFDTLLAGKILFGVFE